MDSSGQQLPFVSVIIPVLNCEPDVQGCIKALRAQTYPGDRFEIIVVDNGSTDGTVANLEAEGIKPLLRVERGRSRALNEGLKHARGTIICSTDISCRPERQWISEVVRSFQDPNVGCVAGEIKLLKKHENLVIGYQERMGYMSPMAARLRTRAPFLPYADGANASFRREVFDAIGPFEESFFKGADVEICYRLLFLTRYKMTFNEQAAVWEPGEPSLIALLKQRFRIGMSNVLLRRRFPALFGATNYRPVIGRRLYWSLHGRFAGIAGYARALAAGTGNEWGERVTDATIESLMSLAQRTGRIYGRFHLARHGIRITSLQSDYASRYAKGLVDVRSRLTWLPAANLPDPSER